MRQSIFDKYNAIYELTPEKDVLPFGVSNSSKSDLFITDNQYLTSATLNTIFNNYVENDLFNESITRSLTTGKTTIPGATVTTSKDLILNSPDGQKFIYLPTDSAATINEQKVMFARRTSNAIILDDSDSSNILEIPDLSGMVVNFVTLDGASYIAGTQDGLLTSTDIKTGWRRVESNDFFQKSFIGENCICLIPNTSVLEQMNNYQYFLATNFGLYGLYSDSDNFYWFKIQNNNLEGINKLAFDPNSGLLYICTNDGLYFCNGINIEKCNNTDGISVFDISFLENENTILIATNEGILQLSKGMYFSAGILVNGGENISLDDYVPVTTEAQLGRSVIVSINDPNCTLSSYVKDDTVNDISYYGLSSNVTSELNIALEHPVTEIVKISDTEFLLNDTFNLFVYQSDSKQIFTIELDNLLSRLGMNKYHRPIRNVEYNETTGKVTCNIYNKKVEFGRLVLEDKFTKPYGKFEIFTRHKVFRGNRPVRTIFRDTVKKSDLSNNTTETNFIIGFEDGACFVKNYRICLPYTLEDDKFLDTTTRIILKTQSGDFSTGFTDKILIASDNMLFSTLDGVELSTVEIPNLITSKNTVTGLQYKCNILNIFCEGNNKYLICTDRGLYFAESSYVIEDDLVTKDNLTISGVSDLAGKILESDISKHIEDMHYDNSSQTNDISENEESLHIEFEKVLNSKLPTKLSVIPDSFTVKSHPVKDSKSIEIIRNDVVDTIEFSAKNKTNSRYIRAAVKSPTIEYLDNASAGYTNESGFFDRFSVSGKTFDISNVPYICKNWKSGMKEIIITVPSTGTLYMNSPVGFSYYQSSSNNSDSTTSRKNVLASQDATISLDNNISDVATELHILLDNSHFQITNISSIQIEGNSLPLKIYKDSVNASYPGRENLFDTIIQSSVSNTIPTISDGVNNIQSLITRDAAGNEFITLKFLCYGTDAQSIRIIAE